MSNTEHSSISQFDRETARRTPVLYAVAIIGLFLAFVILGGLAAILHATTTPPPSPVWVSTLVAAALLPALTCGLLLRQARWLSATGRKLRGLARIVEEAKEENEKAQSQRKATEQQYIQLQAELERRVQERTAALNAAREQLEEALATRLRAETAKRQQTQELVRSKGMLEMHVQARSQELQKLQHRHESILNCAGEGIYELDLEGKIKYANPVAARLTGRKIEDLIGRPEKELFPSANPEWQMMERPDGSVFPIESNRTPVLQNEEEIGIVVIFRDITERKRSEEAISRKAAELSRSNAELEQFAYVASHDLQEPLRKIQAFGERLKTKCHDSLPTDGVDYLERMQSAASRMQSLINDLLAFSRVISTSVPFAPVDLATVIKGVLADLEVRIEQSGAEIEVGAMPTIEADAMQMRQLLQNLIGNALKFQTPNAHPQIKIESEELVSESGERICQLTVQDNGIGFEEKHLSRIFAVFQRLHGRSEFEGTGVGLAICRRITDRHGGVITAHSKPGQGSTFIVQLPVKQRVEVAAA